jgi:hypothetical protein
MSTGIQSMSAESIPQTLAPFFQEYTLERLDLQANSGLIIERTLQFGSRPELRWLFRHYSRLSIAEWIRSHAQEGLPEPHRAFWLTVLEIDG